MQVTFSAGGSSLTFGCDIKLPGRRGVEGGVREGGSGQATDTVIWLGVVFISLRLVPKTPADYANLLQMIMFLARRSGTAEPTSAGSKCAGGIFVRCVKKINICKKHKKYLHLCLWLRLTSMRQKTSTSAC